MKKLLVLMLLAWVGLNAGEGKKLTFEQVFLRKGDVLLNPLPKVTGWIDDRHYVEARGAKILRVNARSGSEQVLFDPETAKKTTAAAINWLDPADHNADYSQLAFVHEDDVFLYQRKTKTTRRITSSAVAEKNPLFSPDGRYLAFTAAGDLFVAETATGAVSRLTEDGSEEILNGYASWIYYEEILGRAGRYRAFNWSPDSSRIAFMRFDQSRVPVFPLFEAAGPYGKLEMQRYPKPGFPNPDVKIGIIDLAGRNTDWIAFPPEIEHYLTILKWAPDGKRIYLQWMNRGQEDLRIFEHTLANRELSQVYRDLQPTWVEPLNEEDFHILADGGLLLVTSKSGWSHIVIKQADNVEKPLTDGKWSVKRIEFVDEKNGFVFFSADKEDSTRTDLYRVSLKGGALQRLTRENGSHALTFSTAGSFYLDRYSSITQPPVMQLCDSGGLVVRRLGISAAPAFRGVALGKVERFRIPGADGYSLPAVCYLPPDFSEKNRYPVVLSVYGGPGARSVADAFPRRLDDYYLAQLGVIVVKVDHRGSGHFGKQGMDLMHRCLGKWEIADYCRAVEYMRTLPYVDGRRIGITGGSYGGYVAALALASAPDSFSCAVAEFAVSDWSLYDSVYTERYMDLPAENPEGYRQASVLSHLATYRGGLRLTHGSMDDNVHMQNALQLLNGILELGKTAELMVYPGERHGIRGKKAVENAMATIAFWKRHFNLEQDADAGGGAKQQ